MSQNIQCLHPKFGRKILIGGLEIIHDVILVVSSGGDKNQDGGNIFQE